MSSSPAPGAGSLEPAAFFDQIYDEHHQALHAYFFGRTGDPETALDLLQETFLRAWRNVETLSEFGANRRRYWLFTVAKNLLTDHYRRAATRAAAEEELVRDPERFVARPEEPGKRLEDRERLELLDEAIGRLPEQLRTVLLMQVLGKMTSGEIGEALDRPAGTIRYQISQARKRLAEEVRLIERGSVGEENGT